MNKLPSTKPKTNHIPDGTEAGIKWIKDDNLDRFTYKGKLYRVLPRGGIEEVKEVKDENPKP